MNGEDDNLLSRWSRRKLATRSQEAPAVHEQEQVSGDIAADDHISIPEPGPPETEAEELDAAQMLESLPRVEDLTAESDITAFLKKGVPMALKRAALRKIWALDPGIRDYVGPSEYAWDFNQPGSMAGFGPLDAKETVVGFLSKAARAIDTVAEPVETAQATDAAVSTEESDALTTERPPLADVPPEAAPTLVAETDVSLPIEGRSYSLSPEASSAPQPPESPHLPRHGGAMPR